MDAYRWFALIAGFTSLVLCARSVIQLIRLGFPKDLAASAGSVKAGIKYSITGAMSPGKKESAYLHMPTYAGGLLFHLGAFLSLFLFFFLFADIRFPEWILYPVSFMLAIGSISGLAILSKRIIIGKLRRLSNVDDYFSNILVVAFQCITLLQILRPTITDLYFLIAGCLFLYIPFGKLKHMIYFFAARIYLGWFFGRRNVWPPSQNPSSRDTQ